MKPIDENIAYYNEELTKCQPDLAYEGGIPEDQDDLDYVKLNLKGVRLG